VNAPDLRRLADLHELRPSYLTIYLDLSKGVDHAFLRKRKKECETALAGKRDEQAAFEGAYAGAEKLLDGVSPNNGSMALFINPSKDMLETYSLPGPTENRMVFDSSPYIKPLVRLHHEFEEYLVIVLDHTHARIFLVAHFEILEEDDIAEEIVRHHRHGGMSQMRFQRLHAGYVDHYFKEVAEHLVSEADRCKCQGRLRGIVLAGPKDAKTAFEKYMPVDLQHLVLGRLDEEADVPAGKVVREAEGLVADHERAVEGEMMERLRGEVLRGGLATYGFPQVKDAVTAGRVDILILQAGFSLGGWRCEHCRNFGTGAPAACPVCGKEPIPVDAIEELIELALDMRSQVEFQPADCGIHELGGVAALLRY
jgi:peptide subunit release factor 1 (eRF1)